MPDVVPERLLQLLLARWPDAVLLTDRDGVILFVNASFTRLYGYSPEEVVGRTTPRLLKSGVHPPDHYARFWQTLLQDGVVTMEMVNRTKDGRLLHVECTAGVVGDGTDVAGFLAIYRELSGRRRDAVEPLAQLFLDAAAHAVYWTNARGRFIYANRAAERMTGYTSDELRQMTVEDLDPRLTNRRFRDALRQVPDGKSVFLQSEHRRKDGTVIPVEIAAVRLTHHGRVYGCAFVQDLTERRRLEAELRQAQKMEAIGRLAGGIAHDFNNLLTAILGYTALLRERLADRSDLVTDLDEIHKAGEQATALTRHLLAFSRRQALRLDIVDLNELVTDLTKMIQRIVGEDIVLETRLENGLSRVKVDRAQIEQVLLNLVVNARDAMPRGGRLTIETANVEVDPRAARGRDAQPGPYVALVVTDTGCGMTPEIMAHIFEPFFTTKDPTKGTGLGLSTVYGIVKQSGGFVTVESEPGAGSTFRVFLPALTQAASAPRPAPRPETSRTGTETILLVEDETAIRKLVRNVLERHGYTVLSAADAKEALALAERHDGAIHLLLSDIVLPGLSGVDLAQRILATRPAMRVMYMSGYSVSTHVGTLSAKVSFIQKPFSPATIVKAVRECLDRNR